MSHYHDLLDFAARLGERICAPEASGKGTAGGWTEPLFNQLALDLFRLQFSSNPPYRRFCESRGTQPDLVREWKQIPALPTEAFKEYDLTCLPESERTAVFRSSGTSGQRPSRHFHSQASLELYERSLWAAFAKHLCLHTAVSPAWLLALTPPKPEAPNSSLVHMFDHIAGRLTRLSARGVLPSARSLLPENHSGGQGRALSPYQDRETSGLGCEHILFGCRTALDGGWEIEEGQTVRFLQETSKSGKPGLILTTAFGLVQLFDVLANQNLHLELPAGTRLMETGGYKGRSRTLPKMELFAGIARWLGITSADIVTEYGMSELSSQAYDHVAGQAVAEANRVFRFPAWARLQVVSPETGAEVADGETGLIRVFDLANVFSVLAVQTSDLGVRRGEGVELIGRAENLEPRGCSLMALT